MLKTNTAITVMKRGAILPTDTEDKVIYGEILGVNASFEEDGVRVDYSYYTPTIMEEGTDMEWINKSYVESSSSFFTFAEVEVMKGLIPAIPEGLTEKEEIIFKYTEALKLKMSEKFGIDVADIVAA